MRVSDYAGAMSELGDALALAHDARERLGTLRALVRRWHLGERWQRAFDRHRRQRGGDATAAWASERREAAGESEFVTRLRVDGPRRMRVEHPLERDGGSRTAVTVIDGERCWSHVPGHGAFVSELPLSARGSRPRPIATT
jgi:hypothetical protein